MCIYLNTWNIRVPPNSISPLSCHPQVWQNTEGVNEILYCLSSMCKGHREAKMWSHPWGFAVPTPTITRNLCLDSEHHKTCWTCWLGGRQAHPGPWPLDAVDIVAVLHVSLLGRLPSCTGLFSDRAGWVQIWVLLEKHASIRSAMLEKAWPPLALGTQSSTASDPAVPLP